MVRYLKSRDELPASVRKAFETIDKYHGETVPMYPLQRRRKALRDHVKVMPDIPARFGPWYIKRCLITIDHRLMESEAERRALNQAMAKVHVPFYLSKTRTTRPGQGRVYIVTCTWHHDGEFFLAVPVSEGEEITATSMLRE